MALQTFDFGKIFELQRPQYEGLRDIVKNYYGGMQSAQEAHFRPQGLQAEIAKRMADSRLANVQAENLPQEYQSQQALRKSQIAENAEKTRAAQQAYALAQIELELMQRLGQGAQAGGGGQAGGNAQFMSQSGSNFVTQEQVPYGDMMQEQVSSNMQAPENFSQMGQQAPNALSSVDQEYLANPLMQALLNKKLGYPGKKQHLTPSGEVITVTTLPSGQQSYEVTQVGRTPESIEYGKESAKSQVEAINDTYAKYNSGLEQRVNFEELREITKDPNFLRATGPVAQYMSKFHPDEDVQAVNAQLKTITGDLVNRASQAFRPRLTNSEYHALQRMKADVSDMPAAFAAKVEIMDALNEMEIQRSSLMYDLMKNGIDRKQAAEVASNQVSMREVKQMLQTENLYLDIAKSQDADPEQFRRYVQEAARKGGKSEFEILEDIKKGEKNG